MLVVMLAKEGIQVTFTTRTRKRVAFYVAAAVNPRGRRL